MALTITTLTAVSQTGARPSGTLDLTFTRAAGSAGDSHTLFFQVTKEGASSLTTAGCKFDGDTSCVKALTNSAATNGVNWTQWLYVENVQSGSHTISVENTSGNDLTKAIMGATIAAPLGYMAQPQDGSSQTNSVTTGTTSTVNVTVSANDIILAGCTEGEIGTHTWSGTGTFTEFSDINGLSESSSAAYQAFGSSGSKTVTCTSSNSPVNRLSVSAIVVREVAARIKDMIGAGAIPRTR